MKNKKDLIKEISDDLGLYFEEAMNTMVMALTRQLVKFKIDPNWKNTQVNNQPRFAKTLTGIARKELNRINAQYEKSLIKGYELMTPEDKSVVDKAKQVMDNIKYENARMMSALTNQVINQHKQLVQTISFDSSGKYEVDPLEQTKVIYDGIVKHLDKVETNEAVKIVYRDGKKMPFKSYMEMNARTTLNQEISKHQMESGGKVGVVFWLCNGFSNCRPQHLSYQGKVYYDERWVTYGFDRNTTDKIQSEIDSQKMMSRQQVENNDPYLGNCPNCRHEFIAVPISDVLSMSEKELLEENGFEYDEASQKNYYDTQRQRYLERKIRRYKFEIEKNEQLLDKAPNGNDKAQKSLNLAKQRLRETKGEMKVLLKQNTTLERDYSRENVRYLKEDLGASKNR